MERFRARQSAMDNILEEENPDWRRFWSHDPSPDNPHEFGECMEDWHDYEWRKEQKEMDYRRKKEEWEKLGETLGENLPEDVVL